MASAGRRHDYVAVEQQRLVFSVELSFKLPALVQEQSQAKPVTLKDPLGHCATMSLLAYRFYLSQKTLLVEGVKRVEVHP